MSAKLLVRFKDFWPNSARAINFFFVPLIEQVFECQLEIVYKESIKVDLEVHSVYRKSKSRAVRLLQRRMPGLFPDESDNHATFSPRAKRRIWYTGENIRPPLKEQFDAYLSYEGAFYGTNSYYLPLWVLNLDWFGKESAHGFIFQYDTQEKLLNIREEEVDRFYEKRFCCIFANHLDNTRENLILKLSKIGQVDVFGYAGKKIVKDKKAIASDYRFILCPENDLYPGYVSEKLLEAYQTSAVPIYWGMDTFQYFNPSSHLNVANYPSLDTLADLVSQANAKEWVYQDLIRAPLLIKPYDFSGLVENLRKHM